MKIIEKLSDMIEEELSDAEKYARCALNYKEENKTLADVFYKLAEEEMVHMNLLHGQVVTTIESYRKQHGDPPEGMKTLYDYLHRKHMQRASEIRVMIGMYKEG